MLKSKIHLARVTDVKPDYEGSLTIDREIMDAVKILPYEKVLVSNMSNTNRFETYIIAAPAGSRTVCLNGPAARLGKIGDRLVVFSFGLVPTDEARSHRPLIIKLDENNNFSGLL
jgi:aspartate 1-decarboxylase